MLSFAAFGAACAAFFAIVVFAVTWHNIVRIYILCQSYAKRILRVDILCYCLKSDLGVYSTLWNQVNVYDVEAIAVRYARTIKGVNS